jgi:hypothetical protein
MIKRLAVIDHFPMEMSRNFRVGGGSYVHYKDVDSRSRENLGHDAISGGKGDGNIFFWFRNGNPASKPSRKKIRPLISSGGNVLASTVYQKDDGDHSGFI